MVNRTTPKKNTSKKGIQKKRMNSTNKQAKRVGGYAYKTQQRGELKFLDTSNSVSPTFAVSTFSAGQLLNGVANGTDASTRIGRKLTIKSLLLKYQWQLAPTSTGGSPLRILVVYDKQANGAAPAITDILLADNFNSPNNLSNRDRFVTIFDRITDPVSTGDQFAIADVNFKSLELEQMFNAGSAGTIADITSGSIYLFVAQMGGIGTANPFFAYRSRIRYTDV